MYIYVLPLLYSNLKVKHLYFSHLMHNLSIYNLFLELNLIVDSKNLNKILFKFSKNIFFIKTFLFYYKIFLLIK
jgi:hypothetical protein